MCRSAIPDTINPSKKRQWHVYHTRKSTLVSSAFVLLVLPLARYMVCSRITSISSVIVLLMTTNYWLLGLLFFARNSSNLSNPWANMVYICLNKIKFLPIHHLLHLEEADGEVLVAKISSSWLRRLAAARHSLWAWGVGERWGMRWGAISICSSAASSYIICLLNRLLIYRPISHCSQMGIDPQFLAWFFSPMCWSWDQNSRIRYRNYVRKMLARIR
jgi:hypothetical protein